MTKPGIPDVFFPPSPSLSGGQCTEILDEGDETEVDSLNLLSGQLIFSCTGGGWVEASCELRHASSVALWE